MIVIVIVWMTVMIMSWLSSSLAVILWRGLLVVVVTFGLLHFLT